MTKLKTRRTKVLEWNNKWCHIGINGYLKSAIEKATDLNVLRLHQSRGPENCQILSCKIKVQIRSTTNIKLLHKGIIIAVIIVAIWSNDTVLTLSTETDNGYTVEDQIPGIDEDVNHK